MPITEFLETNARNHPGETALIEINPEHENREESWEEFSLVESAPGAAYRREISWDAFDFRANRLANLLLARGIKKGEKVAILMMNSLEWLPVYFGILKAGAVAVPLNYRYTAEEIQYCLDLSDSAILFFGPEFEERVRKIKDAIPKCHELFYVGAGCPDYATDYFSFISFCSSRKPPVALTEDDDAAIYFSSGTTGFPKAILHKHRSLTHAALCEQKHHGQGPDDCFLCIPPLYHTGAKMHWFGSLVAGSPAVLLRGVSPKWILETVSLEHCTIVWLLVPWAQDILDAIERGDVKLSDYELSQWRLMHIGAQPVPPSLIKRWKEVFPHHEYDTNYGLSESIGPGCVHLGVENINKVGAIGIPGFGWQAKIVDENHNEIKEANVVGELAVKGPGVMVCYYHNPEATAETLSDDGWLWTGDMARRDEDGFYWLVDRKKDVIITGGENLYPVQIEDFMRACPLIKDVAVIGRPHPRLGEIASAIVELKEGVLATTDDVFAAQNHLTEAEAMEAVTQFCQELPRYKRPREIIFDKVPRNPTGKIEKPRLREKYGAVELVAQQTGK